MSWESITLGQIVGGLAAIVVFLSTFVEIIPIKINPISRILKWIGSKTNDGLFQKIDEIDKRVDNLEKGLVEIKNEGKENRAVMARIRILTFADEIRLGQLHSREAYDQILEDIDYYEKFCSSNPDFKNNKTMYSKQKVLEVYAERLDKNDFL